MKIAIIGGGFYGVYFAYKLSEYNNIKIDLFEKNSLILSETAISNQYRLHTGYHYPRSYDTIYQTILGFKKFKKEFKKFLYFPKKNFYLIHSKSLVSFEKYKNTFKKFNLNFKEINKKKIKDYININEIEGVLNTEEGVILLESLFYFLKRNISKKIKIINSKKITNLDPISGKVYSEKNIFNGYDYILNTTYTDPNLGLDENKFNIKYELTGMVRLKNPYKNPIGLTIMDGDFCSLYPQNNIYSTVSSVKYTPIFKSNLFDKVIKKRKKVNKDFTIKNILNDASKYIKFPKNFSEVNLILGNKVKLKKDINDTRFSMIKQNKKVISILCGKLDAVSIISDEIKKILFSN